MATVDDMSLEEMHSYIDKLQLALNLVHNEIFRTWFQIHHPAPRIRTTGMAHA